MNINLYLLGKKIDELRLFYQKLNDVVVCLKQGKNKSCFKDEEKIKMILNYLTNNINFIIEQSDENLLYLIIVFIDAINSTKKELFVSRNVFTQIFSHRKNRESTFLKHAILDALEKQKDANNIWWLHYLLFFEKNKEIRKRIAYFLLSATDNELLWIYPTYILTKYSDDFFQKYSGMITWFFNQDEKKQKKYLFFLLKNSSIALASTVAKIFEVLEIKDLSLEKKCLSFVIRFPPFAAQGFSYLRRMGSVVGVDHAIKIFKSKNFELENNKYIFFYLSYILSLKVLTDDQKKDVTQILACYVSKKIINRYSLDDEFEFHSFQQVKTFYSRWKRNFDELNNESILRMLRGVYTFGIKKKTSFTIVQHIVDYSLNSELHQYSDDLKRQIIEILVDIILKNREYEPILIENGINNSDEKIREYTFETMIQKELYKSDTLISALFPANEKEIYLYNKQKMLFLIGQNSKFNCLKTLDKQE